ncbi:MAG: 16S rRNA (cytosine(967)-C(5))-methyltransferase RsmB [Pseudomonadota bacterium]
MNKFQINGNNDSLFVNDTRTLALHLLNKIDKKKYTLDNLLEEFQRKYDLPKREKALFNALVYGVLRWRSRLDWIIQQFSKQPLEKTNTEILNILRLGLFQIIHLNRIPISAAVNTSVEIAKHVAGIKSSGYVNAVLRRTGREYKSLCFPDLNNKPEYAISVNKSFPEWMIKRWIGLLGKKSTIDLCDAINNIPPITIRVNTLKTNRNELIDCIEQEVQDVSQTVCSPNGVSFLRPKNSISEMEAFKNGWFQVQDEAAQLVAFLLDPQPGETIMDACAGLGGKTGHIGQLMKNKGSITAIDYEKEKLLKLSLDMERLGITNVKTSMGDLGDPVFLKNYSGKFDRILIDAPCSSMGVIRRNPDIKWKLTEDKLLFYQKRQFLFLDNLAMVLKPGGIIVYAVCSTEPEENEEVISKFLLKHSDFTIDDVRCFQKIFKPFLNSEGFIKTYPHINNMDGFFVVRLKRKI